MRSAGHGLATVACDVRFLRELRAGDVLHIETAVIEVDDKRVRLGHKVFDSATGELVTTMAQWLVHFDLDRRKACPIPAERQAGVQRHLIEWDVPELAARPEPDGAAGFLDAYRDTTKPWEVDVLGHVGFQFYIHRFSAAAMQLLSAMGMTPAYLRDNRRGLSTFEFQLRFRRELRGGELVQVKTGLVHLGNSSLGTFHKMYNLGTGEEVARLIQFGVHLDMAARRSCPMPEEVRQRSSGLLIAATGGA
jgi:acyl-CoA thioester hydrolase